MPLSDEVNIPRFCHHCGAGIISGHLVCLRCDSEVKAPDSRTGSVTLPDGALPEGARIAHRYVIEGLEGVQRTQLRYRARDEALMRWVSLRVPHHGQPELLRALKRQARIQSGLRHPHIVQTFDFVHDTTFNIQALVEEYLGPRTLQSWLKKGQKVSFPFMIYRQIMLPMAQALAFAHRHGVIHRNLKPNKIHIDLFERVKVADFSLGATHLPRNKNQLTLFGTLEYMAPEQAEAPHKLTPAADIYALGVLFYELVSAKLPIKGENDMDLLDKLLHQPAPALVELAPDVPPGLDAIIMRCLEKDPNERYANALELESSLREVLGA